MPISGGTSTAGGASYDDSDLRQLIENLTDRLDGFGDRYDNVLDRLDGVATNVTTLFERVDALDGQGTGVDPWDQPWDQWLTAVYVYGTSFDAGGTGYIYLSNGTAIGVPDGHYDSLEALAAAFQSFDDGVSVTVSDVTFDSVSLYGNFTVNLTLETPTIRLTAEAAELYASVSEPSFIRP